MIFGIDILSLWHQWHSFLYHVTYCATKLRSNSKSARRRTDRKSYLDFAVLESWTNNGLKFWECLCLWSVADPERMIREYIPHQYKAIFAREKYRQSLAYLTYLLALWAYYIMSSERLCLCVSSFHGMLILNSWTVERQCSREAAFFSIGRTVVQWSQIRLSGSEPVEPRVVGSSWRSFPVWWRLANRSSNCKTARWWSSSGALPAMWPKNLKRVSLCANIQNPKSAACSS